MPIASIIIPAHNREKSLKRAIKTALQQSIRDIEVIVVDDGSRDRTAIVAERFADADRRLRVLRHRTNRGAQAARNTGAQAARGRWLTFLDSDDRLLNKSLELRLKVAETEAVDVVHSDCYVLWERSPRRLLGVPNLRGSIYRELLANPGPMFQGMLISARSFKAIGGLDERVIAYQEWDTAIRLAKIGSFGFVQKPTFVYDCNGDDTISKNLVSAARGYEYIVRKHFTEIVRRLGPKCISLHYRAIANHYSTAGDFATARKFKLKSLIWWPSPLRANAMLRAVLLKLSNGKTHLF
jgi:glycosyltransferase involved in cell wall biosynthesis